MSDACRLDDLCLGALHSGIRRMSGALCRFEVRLRDQLPVEELVRTSELEVGVCRLNFGALEIGLQSSDSRPRLLDLRLQE